MLPLALKLTLERGVVVVVEVFELALGSAAKPAACSLVSLPVDCRRDSGKPGFTLDLQKRHSFFF